MPIIPASPELQAKVAITDEGRWCGESHPKVKLTDAQVDRMRELHEDLGWSYDRLAAEFETPKSTVQYICRYRSRYALSVRVKRINLLARVR